MKFRIAGYLAALLFLLAACSTPAKGEDFTEPIYITTTSPVPSPVPSPMPSPQLEPQPEPEPVPNTVTFTYECGVLGVKFRMEQPAEWADYQVIHANPGFLMYVYWNWDDELASISNFIIAEGTLHPSRWREIFHYPIDFGVAQFYWEHPEEPTDVFVTDQGLTVVMYTSTSKRWREVEFTTLLFMFRKDGQDYRNIFGAQIFYYAILDVPTKLLDDYYQNAIDIVNSLQFLEGAEISLRPSAQADIIGITTTNYPRIDGSTSTVPLMQQILRSMFYSRHTFTEDWTPYIQFMASRTVPSYQLLIANYVDMILVPDPSAELLQMAEDAGVELEFIPVGVEALVFITHEDNPITNITIEQILEIYTEMRITNWAQLGGYDGRILPLNRNPHSGSQTQMDNLILQGRVVHPQLAENYQLGGMLDMLNSVISPWWSDNPKDFSLGYTVYFYLRQAQEGGWLSMQGGNIKTLSLNGIHPSHETILSGEYTLATNYFAVLRSDTPENHPARKIANWLLTPAGQDAVRAAGIGTLEHSELSG